MTDTDLLPCPFCGGNAKLYEQASYTDEMHDAWIQCTACHIETDVATDFERYYARVAVIRKWNRRDWSAAMAIVHSAQWGDFTPTTMTVTSNVIPDDADDVILDSPNWYAGSIDELKQRNFVRVNDPRRNVIPDDGNVVQD